MVRRSLGAELALLLVLIYAPPLAEAFGLQPLGAMHWLLLAAFAPVLLLLEEARKALRITTPRTAARAA